MKRIRNRSMKCAAVSLLAILVGEMCTPIAMQALTSGPTAPEFASFEPIGTTGMVNEFTGGFTYNLPVLEVPGPGGSGYPVSLAYHSGGTLEEDATWVGFGWTLNTGAINRSVRGFPDDYNGSDVTRYNSQDKNETFAVGGVAAAQVLSKNLFTFDIANRWNTFTGFSVTTGFSLAVSNMLTLTATTQNGVTKYGANVNWANIFTSQLTDEVARMGRTRQQLSDAGYGALASVVSARMRETQTKASIYSSVANYIGSSFYTMSSPTSSTSSRGAMYAISFGATLSFDPSPTMIGPHFGVKGSYAWQQPVATQTGNAYGFLYDGGADMDDDFTDYSVEREAQYTTRDRFLYGVYNTYDLFNCNAQGVGGMMRLQHRKPGYNAPRSQTSTKGHYSIGFELGVGPAKISAGAEVAIGGSVTTMGGSLASGNPAIAAYRHEKVGTWNNGRAVMRFANDKADNVLFAGDDAPAAFPTSLFAIDGPADIYERHNDIGAADTLKRIRQSSSVTYRTNKEIMTDAAASGPRYYAYTSRGSYNERYLDRGETAIKDGIGEIAVTQTSGMRYVFGLPVYARNERNLTFTGSSASSGGTLHHGIVYGSRTLSARNVSGYVKDRPYASSMLLTEVRTPDYIDRTQNGPSVDDYGGYTHFMYRRAAGSDQKSSTGTGSKWYKWRTPYQGYQHEPGRITVQYDNRATVSMGERELYYLSCIETKTHAAFFVTNRTDTVISVGGTSYHLLGSGKRRKDAFEAYNTGDMTGDEYVCGQVSGLNNIVNTALDPDSAARYGGQNRTVGGRDRHKVTASNTWMSSPGNNRDNKSEYLERIVLLARSADGNGYSEIVKTVNFEYTYELMAQTWNEGWLDNYEWSDRLKKNVLMASVARWDTIYNMPGALNSAVVLSERGLNPVHRAAGNRLTGCRQGKLTLKRMWVDYGNVKSNLISPYEFQYAYRNTRTQAYPTELTSNPHYLSIRQHDSLYTTSSLDADWKVDSASAKVQNPAYDPMLVDPWGAYRPDGAASSVRMMQHLDQGIVGGENGFDPAAWQLKIIKLPTGGEIHVQYEQNTYSYVQDQPVMALLPLAGASGETYTIECSSLKGRNVTDVRKALDAYLAHGERVFFKFLYPVMPCGFSLDGDYIPGPVSEYVTGYAKAVIPAGSPGPTQARIQMTGTPVPRDVLREFIFNQGNEFKECDVDDGVVVDASRRPKDMGSKETWLSLASSGEAINANAATMGSVIGSVPRPFTKRSYIRVPCIWKYGGGVRVKRIFMYDKGIEYGRSAIYGSEYDYSVTENGITMSSGVATNEPATIREENPLVRFMIGRNEQTWIERMASGEDLDQFEGPLCPSVYPSPSIGYRRVTVRNIVQTGSTPGFTVTEFNTAKDYPVRELHTEMDGLGTGIPAIPIDIVSVQVYDRTASQGFSVQLNQMHGTVKRVRKCAGIHTPDESLWNVVESMEHEYYDPGEAIPVLHQDGEATKILAKRMGVDMDVSMETRAISDYTLSGSVPFDLGLVFPFFAYGHAAPPSVSISSSTYRFGVITKVVTYSTFEKRTTVIRDGMKHVVENVAFDEATGNPVVVKATMDQNGNVDNLGTVTDAVMTYTLPAWTMYPQLGARSYNEGAQVLGTVATGGSLTFTPQASSATSVFTPGDLVHFTNDAATAHAYAYVVSTTSTVATLAFAYGTTSTSLGANTIATIVRSGRTNQLTAPAASVTRHGADQAENGTISWSGHYVLAASASTYSDDWDYGSLVDATPYAMEQTNDYEKGTRGKWRPDSTYVYRKPTESIFSTKATRAGRATGTFAMLPFPAPGTRDTMAWIRSSFVQAYNQHGDAVYERDAIGIPSCALFSHGSSVPSIIARNAEYGSTAFLSFEDASGATAAASHTGKKSRALGTSPDSLCAIEVDTRLQNSGLMIRAWTKATNGATCVATIGSTTLSSPTVLADVAGWKLLEWKVLSGNAALTATGVKAVKFSRSGSADLYLDDVRLQPLDAEAACYVYDAATLRLVAQFDDQHFASIYRYDDQGRLKRKERETERGILPLQEVHGNTPAIAYGTRTLPWNQQAMMMSRRNSVGSYDGMGPQRIPGSPANVNAKGDVLDIKLSPDRQRFRLFDGKDQDVRNLDSIIRSVEMPKGNTNDTGRGKSVNANGAGGRHEK